MESCLSKQLVNLRRENGEPDHALRKTSLLALIYDDCLTVDEIHCLKQHLSTISSNNDIVSKLPAELIVMIAKYLELEDITATLIVSRRWRERFFERSVMFSVLEQNFPSLTSSHSNSRPDSDYAARFCYAMRKRRNRTQGLYTSVLTKRFCSRDDNYFHRRGQTHPRDGFEGNSEAGFNRQHIPAREYAGDRCFYSRGKIAWQQRVNAILVDDLVTKRRKIYSIPNAETPSRDMTLVSLGDKVVVATADRDL
ncbi:hypothetical protein F5B20DRAFT_594091 [Whalleya microplaca]|nr:hypothetical protein F5B20DRAFT_594091 [Whalleya microplaca]